MTALSGVMGLVDPRHLWRWLAPVLATALGIVVMNSPWVLESRINPEIHLSAPLAITNAIVDGSEIWVGPNHGGHAEVDWHTAVEPDRRYLIDLEFDNPARFVSPRVHIDLYAKGYDNPEQKFVAVVPASSTGYHASAIVNSGAAPAAVSLRAFHFDRASVHVTRISMRRISYAYDAALTFLGIGLAASLAGLCVSCVLGVRMWDVRAPLDSSRIRAWWLLAPLFSVLAVTVFNSLLGAPQMFGDEYAYSATVAALRSGEWAGLRETGYLGMPNRLFFAAYWVVALAKHPIVAARILNALWLVVGLVPLYLVARACNVFVAGLAVGLAYVLGPLGTYSAYFTPETMFAATFSVACALAALALESRTLWLAIASAVAFAALPYIKPNGWVAVAAMVMYVANHGLRQERTEPLRIIKGLFVAGVVFVVAWMAFKRVLPDTVARTQSLGIYAGVGARALQVVGTPGRLPMIARFLLIHLAVIGCLVGPALAYGLYGVVKPCPALDLGRGPRIARIVTASTAVALLAFVVMTSVYSATGDASNWANELHTRYYAFALPLLVLGFAASPVSHEWSARVRIAVTLLWGIASLALALALQPQWYAFFSPDLFVRGVVPTYAIGCFGVAGAGLALLLRRRASVSLQVTMLASYVSMALVAGIAVRNFQFDFPVLDADRAGRVAATLSEETGSDVVAVTKLADQLWTLRLASYAPGRTRFMTSDKIGLGVAEGLPAGAMLVGSTMDLPRQGVASVARFGDLDVVRLVDPTAAANASPGGNILARGDTFLVSFGIGAGEGVRLTGMHKPDAWGAWSAAPELRINLPFSVRGDLRLAVEGRALGPNVGRPLTLTIGTTSRTFTLANPLTTAELRVLVPEPEHSITISGIEPVSPASLGLSSDDRRLGIGLSSIRIAPQ